MQTAWPNQQPINIVAHGGFEGGSAIVELVVTVLLLLTFIAALLGGALAYRQANAASETVRFAGRTAAALSFDYPNYCDEPPSVRHCGVPLPTTPAPTLTAAAARLTCRLFAQNALPVGDFEASVSIDKSLLERTVKRTGIRIAIQRRDPEQCAFCMLGYDLSFQKVEAVYVIEALCR